MAVDDATASVTGFVLTANDAYTIKCNTIASDRRGDKASASVEVYRGSLYNYHGGAYASSGGVLAVQSFEDARGAQVAVKERASNQIETAITNTDIQNGGILGYDNLDLTFADPKSMRTGGQFENAYGSIIGSESSAYRTCGFRSNAKMDVVGTKTQNGQVSGYGSAAGVGITEGAGLIFETGAQQILSGEARGNTIGLSATSSNSEKDISSLKTDIRGTKTEPGFINRYADLTESFRDSVFADNLFRQTEGNEIYLSSSSSNKKNDRANANMNAVGEGQIINYMSSSSAFAQAASASNDIVDGAIAGKKIEFDSTAFDAARDRAASSTEVLDGAIFGMVSNSAESFGYGVSAFNFFSQAEGNEIYLSSSSSNRKNDRANANMHAVGEGRITNYVGSASATTQTATASNNIIDGTLEGKKIGFDVSAFDAARNRAILNTEALGGYISGTILSSSDITADELTASNIGNDVSGSLMQVTYDGKEVATGETAHGTIEVPDPLNPTYSIVLTINRTSMGQFNKYCGSTCISK